MPATEYLGWIYFYQRKAQEHETAQKLGGQKNLLSSPDDLVKGLTK